MGSLLCCNEQGLRGRVAQWHLELLLYQCAARRFHMSHRRFADSPSAWARALCVAYPTGEPSALLCVSQGKGSRGGCLPLCPASCYLCMRASCVSHARGAVRGARQTVASDRVTFSRTVAPRLSSEAPRHICPGPTRPSDLPSGTPPLALRRSGGGPPLRPLFRIMMPSRQRFFMGMPIFRRLAIANRRARTGGLPTLRRLPANPASLGRCDAAIATE